MIISASLFVLYPLYVGILIIGSLLLLSMTYGSEQFVLKISFVFFTVSAFLGAYLSFPGYESIFLFRILLLAQLFILVLYKDSLMPLNKGLKFQGYIGLLLLIWNIGCFITLFWAQHKIPALRHIYYIFEASCLLYVPSYFIQTRKAVDAILDIISTIYIVSLAIGFFEVLMGWHLKLSGSLVYETTTSQFQPTGFLFNTNDYALFLAMFLPLVFYRFYSVATHKFMRFSGILIWFSSIYLVIMTYSRLGIVSIIIVSLVIYWVYFKQITFLILFFGFLSLLIKELFSLTFLTTTFHTIQVSFTQKGASNTDRLNLYNTIWTIVKKRHFLGVGTGGIPIEIATFRQGYESSSLNFNSAHNFFLESLGEIGLFTIFLVLAIGMLGYKFFMLLIKKTNKTILEYSPFLMWGIFLISSVALSTIVEQRFLWLGLGMALAISFVEEESKEDDQNFNRDNRELR